MNVAGLKETSDALNELPQTVAKRILRKGLRVGAKVVLSVARADAPVGSSGRLRKNIKIRGGRGSNGKIVLNVGVGAKDFTGEAFYASFVLYGHRVGPRRLGNARKLVPANNFLERAYDAAKENAVTVTAETWVELIEASASQGGK